MTAAALHLSPAQKAWVTRRAMAAARQAAAVIPAPAADVIAFKPIEIPVNPVKVAAAPEPWTGAPVVLLYVNDPQLGCGERPFVVLDVEERTVRLFSASRLIAVTVDRRYFDKYHRTTRRVSRVHTADILRRNIAQADRINASAGALIAPDGGAWSPKALEVLAR